MGVGCQLALAAGCGMCPGFCSAVCYAHPRLLACASMSRRQGPTTAHLPAAATVGLMRTQLGTYAAASPVTWSASSTGTAASWTNPPAPSSVNNAAERACQDTAIICRGKATHNHDPRHQGRASCTPIDITTLALDAPPALTSSPPHLPPCLATPAFLSRHTQSDLVLSTTPRLPTTSRPPLEPACIQLCQYKAICICHTAQRQHTFMFMTGHPRGEHPA